MRTLPKPGDRINCDPNRDEGDTPGRWSNPNRQGAEVVAIIDDVCRLIVCRGRRRARWTWWLWTEYEWDELRSWQIGPLRQRPKR
jgi:hypothetical protein